MAHGAHRQPQHRTSSRTAVITNNAVDLRQQQRAKRDAPDDQAAIITYIKRVLCQKSRDPGSTAESPTPNSASEPLDALLPPLTSSNAVDIQLYAFIAVILNLFVQAWYSRITSDQQFVDEIVQIVAHCTRGLEQRLRHVDLESLLLDELPDLLAEHVNALRISQTSRSRTKLTAKDIRLRYHGLRPHVALDPVPLTADSSLAQQENEVSWCLLIVNRVLPLLLPPEDLQNPCLDVLVSEIFSELIFHNGICGKACEPWLLMEGVTKLIRASRHRNQAASGPASNSSAIDDTSSRLNAVEAVSKSRYQGRLDAVSRSFWMIMQSSLTAWVFLRSFLIALVQAASLPPRAYHPSKTSDGWPDAPIGSFPTQSKHAETLIQSLEKRPIISMHVWGCMSQLLSFDRRMPWLSGILSLLQWMTLTGPGQLCSTNSRLDRLMSSTIHDTLLNAKWLPHALQAARTAIFPENALSPARIPPTSDEVVQIKRDCAGAIVEAIPDTIRTRFFATKDEELMRDDVEAELSLLDDPYITKHFIVCAIELVTVRLFPELAGRQEGDMVEDSKDAS